jgi:hypothetical protein
MLAESWAVVAKSYDDQGLAALAAQPFITLPGAYKGYHETAQRDATICDVKSKVVSMSSAELSETELRQTIHIEALHSLQQWSKLVKNDSNTENDLLFKESPREGEILIQSP